MALQFSTAVRNGQMDSIEDAILSGGGGYSPGTDLNLILYSGTVHTFANTGPLDTSVLADPDVTDGVSMGNTKIYEGTGGDPILSASSGGVVEVLGNAPTLRPWNITIANSGALSMFRIVAANGPGTPILQGTIGVSGSGADMIVENVNVVAGQIITINSLFITASNP